MCGAMKDLHIFYEYSPYTLKTKIENLKNIGKKFS